MLASLRLRSVRHALVIMLVILSALVAVERAQAVINSLQHSLAIDHAAPAVELAVAAHEHDHEHDHGVGGDPAAVEDPDHGPAQHHHHSEGPQVAALISPATVEVAVSGSAALFVRPDSGSPQSRIFGLERPPKTRLERA